MNNRDVLRAEALEPSRWLAVIAIWDEGDLVIRGESAGDIVVVADGGGQYTGTEGDVGSTVEGNLKVRSSSAEADSRIAVDEGSVAGDVETSPGKQSGGYYLFSAGQGRTFRRFGFRRS